jgi:hypothetical protein
MAEALAAAQGKTVLPLRAALGSTVPQMHRLFGGATEVDPGPAKEPRPDLLPEMLETHAARAGSRWADETRT